MKRGLVLAMLACLFGAPAFAHAFLDRAVPGAGSEVRVPPPALTLTYTEGVEPLFSHVTVSDSMGMSVTAGTPTAKDDGKTLVVPLKTLPPGTYQVEWHVTSVDTHKTEGHFVFSVKP
jgi:methionine-rich copper-binding protein CopC